MCITCYLIAPRSPPDPSCCGVLETHFEMSFGTHFGDFSSLLGSILWPFWSFLEVCPCIGWFFMFLGPRGFYFLPLLGPVWAHLGDRCFAFFLKWLLKGFYSQHSLNIAQLSSNMGFWRPTWHLKSINIEENVVHNNISKTRISRGGFVKNQCFRLSKSIKNR